MFFSAPCFSGNCQMCASCNNSISTNDRPEHLQRADDLSKFLGKDRIEKEHQFYSKHLKKSISSTDYVSPKDPGFMKSSEILNHQKFKLISKNHSTLCDDSLCKVFYVNSHTRIQSSQYNNLPIYSRMNNNEIDTNSFHLCVVCLQRNQRFKI